MQVDEECVVVGLYVVDKKVFVGRFVVIISIVTIVAGFDDCGGSDCFVEEVCEYSCSWFCVFEYSVSDLFYVVWGGEDDGGGSLEECEVFVTGVGV